MLTKKQLAEELQIGINTIDRNMKKGLPYRKLGKSVRFELDKVLDWYENDEKENKSLNDLVMFVMTDNGPIKTDGTQMTNSEWCLLKIVVDSFYNK